MIPGGPQPPRSCLARLTPEHADMETVRRAGWQEHGILVVARDDPRMGWPEKAMLDHLADILFGRKAAT